MKVEYNALEEIQVERLKEQFSIINEFMDTQYKMYHTLDSLVKVVNKIKEIHPADESINYMTRDMTSLEECFGNLITSLIDFNHIEIFDACCNYIKEFNK